MKFEFELRVLNGKYSCGGAREQIWNSDPSKIYYRVNRESGDFWLYYRPGAKSWVISKGHYLGKRSFASPDDVIQIPSFDILPTFIQQVRNI